MMGYPDFGVDVTSSLPSATPARPSLRPKTCCCCIGKFFFERIKAAKGFIDSLPQVSPEGFLYRLRLGTGLSRVRCDWHVRPPLLMTACFLSAGTLSMAATGHPRWRDPPFHGRPPPGHPPFFYFLGNVGVYGVWLVVYFHSTCIKVWFKCIVCIWKFR